VPIAPRELSDALPVIRQEARRVALEDRSREQLALLRPFDQGREVRHRVSFDLGIGDCISPSPVLGSCKRLR
jgi:hypothetical protein